MSRLTIPTVQTAPSDSKPALEALQKSFGALPNLFATIGNSSAALNGYLAFTDHLGRGALTGREIELINLHVSELNGCAYCVSAHGTLAKRFELSAHDIEQARLGLGKTERENAMFALARRVTRTGGAQAGTELERAKTAGLTDAHIVEIIAHVASKLFTNALAIVGQTPLDLPAQPNLPKT
jgi:uncharacterized peroxidase-related enzyme